MNPVLQEILHNITSRLAALEQSAQSDKLLIDLIKAQRDEIDRLRAAQPEQEPVAVIGNWGRVEWAEGVFPQLGDKIYAAPPSKQWVGLTDEERRRYNDRLSGSGVAEDIEATLKEKNGG